MRRMLVRALLCAATPPYTAAVVTGSITVSRSLNASVLQLDVKATDASQQCTEITQDELTHHWLSQAYSLTTCSFVRDDVAFQHSTSTRQSPRSFIARYRTTDRLM
eukprot:20350-Heterococcus_DN1.PRE.2